MEADYLKNVWEVELTILNEIDRVCKKNGLKYSLAYGTLLGAVRHGGFIPWDDDIDLMMPRNDYNRLSELWEEEAGSDFIIQDKAREQNYTQNFMKIRKDNTAYVQQESELTHPYHTGIFVDIFPAERLAPEGISRKLQRIACMINLLYSREFTSGSKYELVEKILLRLPRFIRMKIWSFTEGFIQKWSDLQSEQYFFPCTFEDIFKLYPANMFDKMNNIIFCDNEYMCVADPEVPLTLAYGNYMALPPENERVLTHHPLVVRFDSNYME